jgi:hypothetical protein
LLRKSRKIKPERCNEIVMERQPEDILLKDQNVEAYFRYLENEEWVGFFLGMYVVFMLGEFVGGHVKSEPILREAYQRYPNTPLFYVRMVDSEEKLRNENLFFIQGSERRVTLGLFIPKLY